MTAVAVALIVALAGAAQQAGAHPAAPASGYDDGGRRDPFRSLVAPVPVRAAAAPAAKVIPGLAGLSVNDAVLRGVVSSGATALAILEAPDGKTYLVHRQDRLRDGVVKQIEAGAVVFAAQTADARGGTTTRDVRKVIRAAMGAIR